MKTLVSKALKAREKAHDFTLSVFSENYTTPILFPILWIDEGIELNDEMVDLLKGQLTNVLNLINILQWTFVGIGSAMIVLMTVWFFVARSRRT